ncbi:MAG: CsbD family protein [Actinobacteria bacterium]|jgi:uncharacterized protein YjbJ (UPF0337 family)|nr:CsbD family protein [Actinomycetota bacterium]
MDPNLEEAKGRVKEAVGDLTDNDDLKAEGAADQTAAKAKGVVDDVAHKVEDVIDSVKDKLS